MSDCAQTITVVRPAGMAARVVEAPPREEVSGTFWIVCPWLKGLPRPGGFWLSALPIHDANAYLAAPDPASGPTDTTYWAVFALDLFRSRETIWRLARQRGITGIINLPSICFFDGDTAATFDTLGFSLESEVRFLMEARSEGFRVGFFGSRKVIDTLVHSDFDVMVSAADEGTETPETD